MKVIDLFNKLIDGEDMPLKIKFDNREYVFKKEYSDYHSKINGFLFEEEIKSYADTKIFLNEEVEIIEEEKEINYVSTYVLCDSDFEKKGTISLKAVEILDQAFEEYSKAINELMEEVKELKNKED